MKSAFTPPVPASRRLLSLATFVAILPLVPAGFVSPVSAATNISYATPAVVTSSAVTSTGGSADIVVPTGTWAVGDVIQFNGTTATTNPFGTTATRYYVVSVSGSTLQVSTTPGGTALNATNTTTATTIKQAQDWFTGSNWTGGVAPNGNDQIAVFTGSATGAGNNAPVVVNGNATIYGLTNNNTASGTDLTLVSGANGTGLYALTFSTNDSSTPKMTLNNGNFLTFLGAAGTAGTLKIAGTQGLIINSMTGGAISGSGTAATSTAPSKQTRFVNVDWSGFSGGIQIERGAVQLEANGQLPNQTLTVGNDQTITNATLAGLSMNGRTATVDALVGNSLGRIYTGTNAATLTVGAANGSGTYAGVIGRDFTGATATGALNIVKSGTGTQTFSGAIAGTGSVSINAGTVVYDGFSLATTGATTVASAATLRITNTVSQGSGANAGRIVINNGGSLTGSGTLTLSDTNGSLTGVSMAGNFAPGDGGIGTFTLNAASSARSAWAFEGTGTLSFDVGAGVTADKLALVGGSATNDVFFNNNVINFTDLSSGLLTTGDYLLFDGDASTGYSGLTLGSSYSGASITGTAITAGLTVGTGLSAYTSTQLFLVGNDIYLNVTAAAIPEPSTYAVLTGLGILGFAVYRRRAI